MLVLASNKKRPQLGFTETFTRVGGRQLVLPNRQFLGAVRESQRSLGNHRNSSTGCVDQRTALASWLCRLLGVGFSRVLCVGTYFAFGSLQPTEPRRRGLFWSSGFADLHNHLGQSNIGPPRQLERCLENDRQLTHCGTDIEPLLVGQLSTGVLTSRMRNLPPDFELPAER